MENKGLLIKLYGSGHLDLVSAIQDLAKEAQTLIREGFDIERIHKYNNVLCVLKNLVASLSQLSEKDEGTKHELERPPDNQTVDDIPDPVKSKTKYGCSSDEKTSILKELTDTICWPLLHNIHPTSDTRGNVLVLLGNVCDLYIECVRCDLSNCILDSLLEKSISFIEMYLLEKPSAGDTLHNKELIDIYTLTEILRSVLIKGCDETVIANNSKIQVNLSKVFDKCLEACSLMEVDLVGRTCVPLLARILKIHPDLVAEKTSKLWDFVKSLTKEISKSRNDDRKICILLCGFANCLFPVNGLCTGIDLRVDTEFWKLLQAGLISKDTVNRKRSLYLVKRIVDICETNSQEINNETVSDLASIPVFYWSKKNEALLSKIWEDVFLLLEVFEEKQVHVIKPLLPRMKKLLEAASSNDSGMPLLHTSWLMTIFARCLQHESIQIIRWSAEWVLSLDYTSCPVLKQGGGEFLSGAFLYSLQEPRLFIRDQDTTVGSIPEVGDRLTQFFPVVWKALSPSERSSFFSKTVENICSGVWSPIPLLYICRGLSFVPESPCLKRDTIIGMREFLTGYMVTVENYIRGAIQCFCVEILLNLTDKVSTSPEEFFHILSLFQSEDCLQRGTTLWAKCSDWLKCSADDKSPSWNAESLQNLLETSLGKYLETTLDSKFSNGDIAISQQLSRFLLLASDAAIATRSLEDKSPTLVMVIETLVNVINSINSHAYMSTHKADKAIQLLAQIVKDLGLNVCPTAEPVATTILKSLYSCMTEMEIYLTRQITGALQTLSDIPVLYMYCDTVKTLVPLRFDDPQKTNLDRLTKACINILTRAQTENMKQDLPTKLSQLGAMSVLGTMAATISETTHNAPIAQNATDSCSSNSTRNMRELICSYGKEMKVNLHFSKPVVQNLNQQEWGKLVSLYLQSQWEVLQLSLLYSDLWCGTTELLNLAQETLSVCAGETLVPVLRCIKLLLPQVVSTQKLDDSQINVILEACWGSLEENRRHPQYWQILSAFVETVYQSCLIMKLENSVVIQSLNKFASALVSLGEDKNGVANILVKQLCLVWSKPGITEHIAKFLPLIVQFCMFGNIQKKRDRQVYDTCATVEALGDRCSVNELKDSISKQDTLVRATIFSFLCSLNPAHSLHRHLATSLIKLTIEKYVELSRNQSLTFINSLVHRQRHRLVQLLLLTESFIEDDFLPSMWKFLWRSLEQEHQPSIRHMLEWEVMWLMYRHVEYRKQIWILFEKYRESKNFVLCSLLCIVIHMGPHLPPQEQEDYYNQAIPSVLPWCLAHHFHTRIFAQATMVKLWNQCQELGLTSILKAHSILQVLVDFNQGNRNSTKNVKKLLDSFFFKFLDFRRDFSIETIFHTLPCMTGLSDEDWVAPSLFIQANREWGEGKGSCFIQLYNKTDSLKTCDPGVWRWRGGYDQYDHETEAADDSSTSLADGNGDVQKKIMPWKQMVPDEETTQEMEYGVKERHEDGLVVVTSLISKVPNLGGLCRTSEIFGVSEYVLGKLQYTEDKAFQGLSVTAQKWLPITEVHESQLPEYLHQKRQEGYTLVGVEQTANSVCLTDYTFPVKTLLLLGNEKEGIPVDLISLLDVCVEIPQQGVIRSLNVHVSGALLIWEYRRQQLMKAKS